MTEIILGGKQFDVKPFTIGQLRQIWAGIIKANTSQGAAHVEELIGCVRLALVSTGQVTADDFPKLEATIPELQKAYLAILDISGLGRPKEDATPGEEASPSSGPISMAS